VTAPIDDIRPYAEERAAFLEQAAALGARIEHHVHPLTGPDGEELATDVARFGAPVGRADRVVMMTSGVHGVEGHAGHGLQRQLMSSGRLRSLPEGMAVVLVHAVNPYGWAWSRRVDHENVDVNRNFLDYSALPDNPLYAELDPIVNPTGPELDPSDLSYLDEVMAFWARVGDHVAMKTLNGGQYRFPKGIQFGGQHATWSRTTLESIWDRHLPGAEVAVDLDVHTGLGPLGRLTVFQTADADEPRAELGDRLYPDHMFRTDRTVDEPLDHGLLGPGFDAWREARAAAGGPAPGDTITFVLEFGGLDIVNGLTVFRADNWLHHHGDPGSETGRTIRRMVEDHFFVRDGDWRRQVAEQGEMAWTAALDEWS
jgi:hypothetical protein